MAQEGIVDLVLKDLSFQIVAAALEVHNSLGVGFLEKVYENALAKELRDQGHRVEQQKEVKVFYKGIEVGAYFADLVVNDQLIIELKVAECLQRAHEAQLMNYLRASKVRLGLLLNFGKTRLEHKRFVF
jgi:GxxExxY protein